MRNKKGYICVNAEGCEGGPNQPIAKDCRGSYAKSALRLLLPRRRIMNTISDVDLGKSEVLNFAAVFVAAGTQHRISTECKK